MNKLDFLKRVILESLTEGDDEDQERRDYRQDPLYIKSKDK